MTFNQPHINITTGFSLLSILTLSIHFLMMKTNMVLEPAVDKFPMEGKNVQHNSEMSYLYNSLHKLYLTIHRNIVSQFSNMEYEYLFCHSF